MSKRFNRGGSKRRFQKKKMPMARRKVDIAQNNKLVRIEKRIKKIENTAELKYFSRDLQITADADASLVGINLLMHGNLVTGSGIQLGTNPYNRVGYEITVTSLQITALVSTDADRVSYSPFRIIIFGTRAPYTALPTIQGDTSSGTAALLNSGTSTGTLTTCPDCFFPYSLEYAGSQGPFKVYYDRIYMTNPPGTYTDAIGTWKTVPNSKLIRIKLRMHHKVKYDSSSGAVADQAYGGLYIAVISDNDTDPPVLSGMSRVIFKDS